jgi:benzodiazapine receptor
MLSFQEIAVLCAPLVVGFGTGRACEMPTSDALPMRPPGPAFGVIWTVLYLVLGYVGLYALGFKMTIHWPIAALYLFNLACIFAWPLVFSCGTGKQLRKGRLRGSLLLLALALVSAVTMTVILNAKLGREYYPVAALVPYNIWLGFATYLNAELLYTV